MPVVERSETLAVLLPFRAFHRDLSIYGEKAGWVKHAIKTFQTMPPRHGGKKIPASRLIAVLQGWDVTKDDIAAQIRAAKESGAGGYIVSYCKIEQRWEPRLVKLRSLR